MEWAALAGNEFNRIGAEMTTTDQNFAIVPTRTAVSPIDSLTDALITERRLLDELISVMRRQRTAVGDDDLQRVGDSVFATHRILVTLNEARRRRRALNTLLGQREDIDVHSLDAALGRRMTSALREARDGLHTTARALSREVALNRRILREALACGGRETVSGGPRRDEP